ncbi:MAG: hypothetical protein A2992_05100 [Elusimicrobia bacterium RIFCSPLOWO2_01_FULL_59_12]|nr:MAG: hypothetical protein A2992_05100 [Elusimicrobia bacterium RIFCSPLOWO2_01_FULL_59_12]
MSDLTGKFQPFESKEKLPVAQFNKDTGRLMPESCRFKVVGNKLIGVYRTKHDFPNGSSEFQVKHILWANLKLPSPSSASWNDDVAGNSAKRKILLQRRAELKKAGIPGL